VDIKLDQLDGSGFVLELPATDDTGARTVALERVVDLAGTLRTQPGHLELAGARASLGMVHSFTWPLAGGAITVPAPAELSSARLDLSAPRGGSRLPVELDAELGHIEAGALRLELPGLLIATGLQSSAIEVRFSGGALTARAATARTTNFQLAVAGLMVRGAVSVSGLRFHRAEGEISASAATVTATEVSMRSGPVEIIARGVTLPAGIAIKGAEARPDTRIDHASIHELEIDIDLSAAPAIGAGAEPGAEVSPEEEEAPVTLSDDVVFRGDQRLFDLRDLDRLSGSIELGLAVEAQIPVVGTYSLARTFHIPIAEGSFDFVDVERQLSTLEDAFIDFAVREGALVLKRDIPLLPTRGKTLVSWPLSPVEQALAANRVIRVRTLARAQTPPQTRKDEGKATIKQVRIENPLISLSLAPAAPLEPGDDPRPAISLGEMGTLSLTGGLRYRNPQRDQPGLRELAVALTARAVSLALRDLPAGGRSIAAPEIGAAELEAAITEWQGFTPRRISIRGRDLEVRQLAVRGGGSRVRAGGA
jgi:hypothetical protein